MKKKKERESMNELYEAIEKKIKSSGYPRLISGEDVYDDICDQIEDKVNGLDLGANDYLTKPFHFQELEARIRSLTRRKFVQEDVCLKWNQLTFDTRTRETSVNGVPISLTRKESSLLEYFLLHQNRVISPEEMIEHIWDGSVNTFSNSIRVHISSLRKKLKAAIGFDPIQNKIGQGYILEEYR